MNQLTRAVLDGEIIGPGEGVRVIGTLHPLRNDRTERVLPAGLSVTELLAMAVGSDEIRLPYRFIVHINGEPVPEAMWSRVRLKTGTTLTFRTRLEGGAALRSIALIAVAVVALVVAPYLAGALGFAAGSVGFGIASGMIGAAITIGGTMLVNALFPVRPPQLADQGSGSRNQTYSIGGGRNQATQYGPIPAVLGRHRVSPWYAAQPVTEIVGDDQYLKMLVVWGYGPLDITDLKIGETPVSAFDDVQVETRYGYPSDAAGTIYTAPAFEEQLSIELTPGAAFYRVSAENVTALSIDATAPNGIFRVYKKNGAFIYHTVQIRARYRSYPSGSWIDWGILTLSNNVQGTMRRGLYKTLPAGQYEVECVRLGSAWAGLDQVSEQVVWTAMRSFRNQSVIKTRKPVAWTAIRIKASAQLNGGVDTLNGLVTSKVKAWNGSVWANDTASNNPADLFRHVLQGPANARPVPDSKIDLQTLQAWGAWCIARGYRFNLVLDAVTSVYSMLSDIAAAGRAVPILRDGKWSVIYDRDDLPVTQAFTPRNSWGFKGTQSYKKMPHAFRVRFLNEKKDYAQDERVVYADGYTANNATLFENIEFPGITNPDLIWKFGRYQIAQVLLRPATYTLQCDFENLVCTRGDRVSVAHDAALIGQIQGRIRSVNTGARTVTIDEAVSIETGKTYGLRARLADGSLQLYSVQSAPGVFPPGSVLALGPGPALPGVGDLVMLGETGRESATMRVMEIQPGADLTATLTLVDDAPGIYEADKGDIPDFDSKVSDPVNPAAMAPLAFTVGEYIYAFGTGAKSGAFLSWQVAQSSELQRFEIQIKNQAAGSGWKAVDTVQGKTDYKILDLPAGVYSFQIRTLYGTKASAWVAIENKQLLGLLAPPPDAQHFNIAVLGDIATLSWDPIAQPNLKNFEIRHSPLLSGVNWSAATPLLNAPGTQVQVPALLGTYLIKAVTQQGVASVNAISVTSETASLTNFNAVESVSAHPNFIGTREHVAVIGERLQVDAVGNAVVGWPSVSALANVYIGTGTLADEGFLTLPDTIDLGEVYTSRVMATIEAYGNNITNAVASWINVGGIANVYGADPSEWEVEIQCRRSPVAAAASSLLLEDGGRLLLDGAVGALLLDDADAWSEWEPLVAGDISAQKLQFRACLRTGRDNTVTPVVKAVSVTVDMPDRIEAMSDLTVPTSGLRVDFAPPFKQLQALAVDGQGLSSGDRREITERSETGFTVRFFNAANQPVARSIDVIAKGYGKAA